jgi:hypothetical protein
MKIQNELLVVILLIDSRNFCLYWWKYFYIW